MPHPNPVATTAAARSWRAAIAAAVLLLLLPAAAWAQQSRRKPAPVAKTDTTVYTYVEQMPVMQDGGGIAEMISYTRHEVVCEKGGRVRGVAPPVVERPWLTPSNDGRGQAPHPTSQRVYIARHTRLRHCNGPVPLPEKSRILVAFIVTETGCIRGAHTVQGIGCGNNEAVLAAVR